METAKQVTVSLVNKPGRLAALLSSLSKERINLRALAVMDSGDRGKLRFIPDNPKAAASALDSLNVRYELADVLMVDVANHPGAFNHLCERLAAEHLNIDYAYCSVTAAKGKKAMAVIRVNDLAKAQRVLASNGGHQSRFPRPGRSPMSVRASRSR